MEGQPSSVSAATHPGDFGAQESAGWLWPIAAKQLGPFDALAASTHNPAVPGDTSR
jgi:hypothetical protein